MEHITIRLRNHFPKSPYPNIQIAGISNSALYPIFPNLSTPNPYIFLTNFGEK
jgi:hypothetical protein